MNKKLKFNTIDACIVAVMFFIVLGTVIRLQIKSSNILGTEEKNVTVYLDVIDKNKTLSDTISPGDTIYQRGSGKELGEITGVINRNNKKYVQNQNVYDIVYTDDLYRVLVKFDTVVYQNENGMFTNENNFIAPGLIFEFECDNAVFIGTVNRIVEN